MAYYEIQEHGKDDTMLGQHIEHPFAESRETQKPSSNMVAKGARRHTAPRFRCSMCPSDFTSKHNLESHMKSHRLIRPHKCLGCGKSFGTAHVLRRHESKCKDRSVPSSSQDSSTSTSPSLSQLDRNNVSALQNPLDVAPDHDVDMKTPIPMIDYLAFASTASFVVCFPVEITPTTFTEDKEPVFVSWTGDIGQRLGCAHYDSFSASDWIAKNLDAESL
ncbi:hypothetical protein DL96DRAFT_596381 [Flagelloscypha sp. PMI_526]|nr:hypothetical protein DL96DRAFT_596381 [Flagelloscypha sp. PMI_526]